MDNESEEPVDAAALILGGKEVDWCVYHLSPSSPDQYIIDLVITNVPSSGETVTVLGLYLSAFTVGQGNYISGTVRMAPQDVVSRIQRGEGKRMTWTELKEHEKRERAVKELNENAEKLKEAGYKLQATGEELKTKGAELRESGFKKMKDVKGTKTNLIIIGIVCFVILICCSCSIYFHFMGNGIIGH